MVALVKSRGLDFAGETPGAARAAIRELLDREPTATRKVYAGLARKVWSLLIERRLDDEIRDWHGLILGVKAWVRSSDIAASERMSALADLMRELINLAETSPAREVAARPRARAILELLNRKGGFVSRGMLLDVLELGSSHLSNVLTKLIAYGLVERREQGKQAEFTLTPLGREIVGKGELAASHTPSLPHDEGKIFGLSLQDLLAPIQNINGVMVSHHDFFGLDRLTHKEGLTLFLPATKTHRSSAPANDGAALISAGRGLMPAQGERYIAIP